MSFVPGAYAEGHAPVVGWYGTPCQFRVWGLLEELLRLGLLSREIYADSSLVKAANVHNQRLSRTSLTVAEFRERAIEENRLSVLSRSGVDENGVELEETRHHGSVVL